MPKKRNRKDAKVACKVYLGADRADDIGDLYRRLRNERGMGFGVNRELLHNVRSY